MSILERVSTEKLTPIDIARYEFAKNYVPNKKVLDIACGSGYGTIMLYDAHASSVTGVDINEESVKNLKNKYANKSNLFFINSSGYSLPFEDNSFEVIISIETFEHLEKPDLFISECHRVLNKESGTLIVSTPLNDGVDRFSPANPFHVREYNQIEMHNILTTYFPHISYEFQSTILRQNWLTRCLDFLENNKIRVRSLKKYLNNRLIAKIRSILGANTSQIVSTKITKKKENAHVIIAICTSFHQDRIK